MTDSISVLLLIGSVMIGPIQVLPNENVSAACQRAVINVIGNRVTDSAGRIYYQTQTYTMPELPDYWIRCIPTLKGYRHD